MARMQRPKPSACVLSMSPIADDPRVRRQGQALHDAGWKVFGAGMPGARSAPPVWPIFSRDNFPGGVAELSISPPPPADWIKRALGGGALAALDARIKAIEASHIAVRDAEAAYRLRRMSIRWRPVEAHQLYWTFSSNIHDIYRAGLAGDAYLWIANDWSVLPIAERLAKERGGVYIYDTHELAMDEYGQIPRWRIYDKALVDVMERSAIRDASGVLAISRGIADKLREVYGVEVDCIEVRNTPNYQAHPFRPCGEEVRVLYHGIVVAHRGLEAAVASIPHWPQNFTFTMRGPVSDAFRDELLALARQCGVESRVIFAPPVPMTDLIREANAYDIGLCTPPAHSQHNFLSLPNKVFEYIMAGLALLLTKLPEHERLVDDHGVGFITPGEDPQAIGTAIAAITPEMIETSKRNSLAAARHLCWEREQRRFLDLCSKATGIEIRQADGVC